MFHSIELLTKRLREGATFAEMIELFEQCVEKTESHPAMIDGVGEYELSSDEAESIRNLETAISELRETREYIRQRNEEIVALLNFLILHILPLHSAT